MATSIVRNINNAVTQVNAAAAAAAAGAPAPVGSMTTEQGVSLYLEYTKTLQDRVKVLEEESNNPKALQVKDLNRETHDLQEAYNALRVNNIPSAGILVPALLGIVPGPTHNLSGALVAAGIAAPVVPLKDVTFQRYDLAQHVLDNLGPRIAKLHHEEHVVPEFKRNLEWYNIWSQTPPAPPNPDQRIAWYTTRQVSTDLRLPNPLNLREPAPAYPNFWSLPPSPVSAWSLPPILGLAAAPAFEYFNADPSTTTKPPKGDGSKGRTFTFSSSNHSTDTTGSFGTPGSSSKPSAGYAEQARVYGETLVKLAKEHVTPTRALVWGATTMGTVWLAKKAVHLLSKTPKKDPTLNPNNEVRYRLFNTTPRNDDREIGATVVELQNGYKNAYARLARLEVQFEVEKKDPKKTNYPDLYADLKIIRNEARSLKESIDELDTTIRGYNKYDITLTNLEGMVDALMDKLNKLAKELSYDERNPTWSLWKSLTKVQTVGMAILPVAVSGMFAGDHMGNDILKHGSALVYGSAILATLLSPLAPSLSMPSMPSMPSPVGKETDPAKRIQNLLKEVQNGTLQPHFDQIRKIPGMLVAGNLKGAVDAYDKHVARVNQQVIKLHERAREGLFETSTLKVDLETLELEHHVLDEVYPKIHHQLMLEKKLDDNFKKANEAHREWSDLKVTFPKLREFIEKPKKLSHVKLTAKPSNRPLSEKGATISSISDEIRVVKGKLERGKLIVPADDFKPLLSKLLQQCKDLRDNFGNKNLEKDVLKANLALILNDYRELIQLGYTIEEKTPEFNQSNLQTMTEIEGILLPFMTEIEGILLPLKIDITRPEPWFSNTTKIAVPCMALAGLTLKFNEKLQTLTAPEAAYTPDVFVAIAATAVATKALSWAWSFREKADNVEAVDKLAADGESAPARFSKMTKYGIPSMVGLAAMSHYQNDRLQQLAQPHLAANTQYLQYTPHVLGGLVALTATVKVANWVGSFWQKPQAADSKLTAEARPDANEPKPLTSDTAPPPKLDGDDSPPRELVLVEPRFSKMTKYGIPSMVGLAAMSHYQNDKLQQFAQPHLAANTKYLQYTPHVLGGLAALTVTVKVVNWVRSFWKKPEAVGKSEVPKTPSEATVSITAPTTAEIMEQARLDRLAAQPENPVAAKGRIEQFTSEFDRTKIKLFGLVKDRKFSEASQTVTGLLDKVEALRHPDLISVDRAILNSVVTYLQNYVISQPQLQVNHRLVRSVPAAKPTVAAPLVARVIPTVTPKPVPVVKPTATPLVASAPTQVSVKKFTGFIEAGKYLPSQTLRTRSGSYTIREAQLPIALMSVVSSLRDATGTLNRAGQYGATKHRNVLAAKPTTVSEQLRALSGVTEHVPTFTVEAPRIESRDTIDFKRKLKEVDQLRQKSGKSQILVPIMMQDAGYVLSIEDKKGKQELVLSGVQPHPEALGTKGHFRTKFTSIDEAARCLKQMNRELTKLDRGTSTNVSFHPCIPNQLIAAAAG